MFTVPNKDVSKEFFSNIEISTFLQWDTSHQNNRNFYICIFFSCRQLTCEVFQALAGVSALSAAALSIVLARSGVAQVDLGLAIVPCETDGTAAAQPIDGVDGPKQNRVGGDEGRGAVELQHRHTLHVVFTGLAQADVVIKRQHLETRFQSHL